MKYQITPLGIDEWKDTIVPIGYTSKYYYDIEISNIQGYEIKITKKEFKYPVTHTPEEYNYPDTLFQSHRKNAQAFGVVDEDDNKKVLKACIEFCPEEYTNRLVVTELWVSEELTRQGIGTKLINIAKEYAKQNGYRVVILETQSCNVRAIDFYLSQGFTLIGFDTCQFNNNDIQRHEARLNFGFFINNN